MWPLAYKIKFLLLLPQQAPLWVILNMLIYIFLTLSDVFLYIVSITNPENVCNNSNIGFDGPGHFLAWICKNCLTQTLLSCPDLTDPAALTFSAWLAIVGHFWHLEIQISIHEFPLSWALP